MNYKAIERRGLRGRRPGRRWIVFAKVAPFHEPFDPLKEDGDLWFEFGNTEAEARSNISEEMIRLGLEVSVKCDSGEPCFLSIGVTL